jgi:iron(III) transport system substrate-binding protein
MIKMKLLTTLALALFATTSFAQDITLYSNREPGLLKPVLDNFTKTTNIKVNVLFIDKGVIERLEAEGTSSPADIVLLTDAALLEQAKAKGLTQKLESASVAQVPAAYKDADLSWVGLTQRARLIYASKERVKDDTLTYEDLANPRFKGKICIRSGQHPYNLSLFAAALAHMGEVKAQEWLMGLKANLARPAGGGDRDVARDIAAGLCDIGIANSYYFGLMAQDEKQKAWVSSLKPIFATFKGDGTHINVSGAFITKNAKNLDAAKKLLTFMLSPSAQSDFVNLNFESPVITGVKGNETIQGMGNYKPDSLPLSQIVSKRKEASELVEKVGFDK